MKDGKKDLKKLFEKFYDKYIARKVYFKKRIDLWGNKGWDDIYKRGLLLLSDADQCAQEIKQMLVVTAEGEVDVQTLKTKIKNFKNIYKELHESTKPAWRQWAEAIVIALVLAIILRHTIFSPYHVPTGSAEPNILVGDRIWGNKMAYYFNDVKHGDLVIFNEPRHVYDQTSTLQYLWQKYVGFEITLFGFKAGPINVVKRVIGVPGDTIEGRVENGRTVIYRNGKKLNETYVNKYPLIYLRKKVGFIEQDSFGPFKIPIFLKKQVKEVRYTYDMSKALDQQPFYTMKESEIIRVPGTLKPLLDQAFAPIYPRNSYGEFLSIDTFGPTTLPENMYWVMGDSRKNSEDSRYWGPLHRKFITGRASFILFSLDSEEIFWLFDLIKHTIDFWSKHIRWSRFFKGLPNSGNDVEIQAE